MFQYQKCPKSAISNVTKKLPKVMYFRSEIRFNPVCTDNESIFTAKTHFEKFPQAKE
jgi:hypothetical protein